MRAGLVQICAGDDPQKNLPLTLARVAEAVDGGAELVLTPEVTNCVSTSRKRQSEVLTREEDDVTLNGLRKAAQTHEVWILIGSLALKTDDPDGRFANRSFLIAPSGEVTARYDKIHMFDVDVSETESYRESAGYRPGTRAVLGHTDHTTLGMTICYDLRFPNLYHALAKEGAEVLTVPSAFSPGTGPAHWETLLRARAIETGCFVLAPAQTGQNTDRRATYGHSLAVAPWGEVLVDAGEEPCVTLVDLDLSLVEKSRQRIPSVFNDRSFESPT
ncbi:carbon-nitrogen hydrolase family protein [Maritimibacter sp. UBA3975]|uniref:carbon-nitrogen hydrolase family protein n=1 Tax=Maritimibacter sp. UBA3975 TaxID=1946833 RepID=UPI000C09542D|nr:carbon-nitrogen hydrolase family protein [Maritimibacter sp. UBA3975]MAM63452.1 amidohydrolase [Maritimibacter sp.]|tara:strand:+ start:27898 stop:28719 length:822 start_codon:yes stop_codon:yes gene_type:complete